MEDHDGRFKNCIRICFREFLELFLPDGWYDRLDLEQEVEWLEQETYLDPLAGEKKILDLVAKVATKEPVEFVGGTLTYHQLLLIHIELESADKTTLLLPRLPTYYRALRARYGVPVIPLTLFLRVGGKGQGWEVAREMLWGALLSSQSYWFVGLPALDWRRYLEGDNPLGVALSALMKIPEERKVESKLTAYRKIAASGENEAKKFILTEIVDTYLPLDEEKQKEFDTMKKEEEIGPDHELLTPWRDHYAEIGRVAAQREMLRMLLEQRFPPFPDSALDRLNKMSSEEMTAALEKILTASSLDELLPPEA